MQVEKTIQCGQCARNVTLHLRGKMNSVKVKEKWEVQWQEYWWGYCCGCEAEHTEIQAPKLG